MADLDTHNKLFSYFLVMGVDAESEGKTRGLFSLFDHLDISYQKIHEGKITPKFLDVYPPFMGGKTPQCLHKYEMVEYSAKFFFTLNSLDFRMDLKYVMKT